MSKGMKIGLMVIGGVVVAGLLVSAGFALASARRAWNPSWGPGMMARFPGFERDEAYPYGGMMGGYGGTTGGYGGMMGGYGGMMGGSGGMMGADRSFAADPLSLEQAQVAVTDYLQALGDDDLALGEVMIFDNHAYAQIVESGTGIGAMEVLVDPVTLAVYPEFGPNMMWNAKYGHMAGAGVQGMMGGGMMGGWTNRAPAQDSQAEMPVSESDASEIAQAYLDQLQTGLQVEDHADRFYGYYTLHVLRDGATVGMLSVNGYTGQVFLHNWHGDFIEMSE